MLDKEKWFIDDNEHKGVSPHTVKKFTIIESYVENWAVKILQYATTNPKINGIIFIDCMCNSGIYADKDGNQIYGTPILVVKKICEIMQRPAYLNKKAILFFNDKERNRIETFQSYIESNCVLPKNITINYYNTDANLLLSDISNKLPQIYNTLLLYDPYQAEIDWSALSPFLNKWGELLLNHMIYDSKRGISQAKTDKAITKYEQTYQSNICKLLEISERKDFEGILQSIIEEIMKSKSAQSQNYISSFPLFNTTNGLIYNLIHFTHNIEGIKLFKQTVWKAFGGHSSNKKSRVNPDQLVFGETNIENAKDIQCYNVNNIADYIIEKYKNTGSILVEDVWKAIEPHPIFPTDGFKSEIKQALKGKSVCVKKIDKKEYFVFS
jgi:three-Cys-motif partner protein